MKIAILILTLFLISCESSDPKTDKDLNDTDSLLTEIDKVQNDVDTTVPDPDTVEIDTEQPDVDADTDADTAVPCLDLRYNENTIKTNFPFKDKNGKPTFCRPGCDTPTENDPQCVRNIWEWNNWGVYQTYINDEEKKTSPECYPWPCVIEGMKAFRDVKSGCDRSLSAGNYSSSMGTIGDLRVSGGIAGIEMGGYVSGYNALRAMAYNIEKDEYEPVGYTGAGTGFNYGRFLFATANGDWSEKTYTQTYIISAKRNDKGSWKYEIAYTDENNKARFSRPPFMGKDWVLIQVEHLTTGDNEVFYSKVDEWKWTKFAPSKVYEGNISGNRLTFIIGEREIYVCDLDKTPKELTDCTKINRNGELGHGPRLDQLNPDRLVYNVYGEPKFVEVDLSVTPLKYTEHIITPSEPTAGSFQPNDFRNGTILYSELFGTSGADFKQCFYNMEQKKSYCPNEGPWGDKEYLMGFGTFDGIYQLWKAPARTSCYVRDIKCWCEENKLGCETIFGE